MKVSLDEIYRAAVLFLEPIPGATTANDWNRAYGKAKQLAAFIEEQESKRQRRKPKI